MTEHAPHAPPSQRGGHRSTSGVRAEHMTTRDGRVVRDAHRERLLLLTHQAGYVTVHEAALLHPQRTRSAAMTAARRTLAGCIEERLLQARDVDGARLYGLTAAGARWLHEHGHDEAGVRPTLVALAEAQHHVHRAWATRVCLHALARGAENVFTERELLQNAKVFRHRYRKVPDALVFWNVDGERWASWHEVDMSRRNRADGQALTRLVEEFTHAPMFNDMYRLDVIVVHARTARHAAGAQRAVSAAKVQFQEEAQDGLSTIKRHQTDEPLCVLVEPLPTSPPWVTDDDLPWRNGGAVPLPPRLESASD